MKACGGDVKPVEVMKAQTKASDPFVSMGGGKSNANVGFADLGSMGGGGFVIGGQNGSHVTEVKDTSSSIYSFST